MSNEEYDPQEDPIYLQRKEIENTDVVIEKLIDISHMQERQTDALESINRKLSAINSNIMFAAVVLIIIGIVMVFK